MHAHHGFIVVELEASIHNNMCQAGAGEQALVLYSVRSRSRNSDS